MARDYHDIDNMPVARSLEAYAGGPVDSFRDRFVRGCNDLNRHE